MPSYMTSLVPFLQKSICKCVATSFWSIVDFASVCAGENYVNGFPAGPDFFPIGVWMQSPERASQYKRLGITPFREDGIFGHPEIAAEVRTINNRSHELAPVLNSASELNQVAISPAAPIAAMVKRSGDVLYLFAVSMRNESATVNMDLSGMQDSDAVVDGENRTLAVRAGRLTGSFRAYEVHIYKIARSHSR